MALDPGFPYGPGGNNQDDVYERIMKQQRKRKRRVYALIWGLSILAVCAGAYFGWNY